MLIMYKSIIIKTSVHAFNELKIEKIAFCNSKLHFFKKYIHLNYLMQ